MNAEAALEIITEMSSMKKILSMIAVLALVLSMSCTVFAAEEFVPSIEYKDTPEVVPTPDGYIALLVDGDGNVIEKVPHECLVVTPLSQVYTSDEIPEESREVMIDVYNELRSAGMKLPFDGDKHYVIRDLFDISWLCDEHREMFEKKEIYLQITLRVHISANEEPLVLSYCNEEWGYITEAVNNGDSTITCTIEEFCPFALAVHLDDSQVPPAQTGDANGNMFVWVVLMAVSAAALFAVVVLRRKQQA